jgi:hypothetical protein
LGDGVGVAVLEDVVAVPTPMRPAALPASRVVRQATDAELPVVISKAGSRWRAACGWLGIVAGAAVFVAALALSLDDPALVMAWMLVLRGGRLIAFGPGP